MAFDATPSSITSPPPPAVVGDALEQLQQTDGFAPARLASKEALQTGAQEFLNAELNDGSKAVATQDYLKSKLTLLKQMLEGRRAALAAKGVDIPAELEQAFAQLETLEQLLGCMHNYAGGLINNLDAALIRLSGLINISTESQAKEAQAQDNAYRRRTLFHTMAMEERVDMLPLLMDLRVKETLLSTLKTSTVLIDVSLSDVANAIETFETVVNTASTIHKAVGVAEAVREAIANNDTVVVADLVGDVTEAEAAIIVKAAEKAADGADNIEVRQTVIDAVLENLEVEIMAEEAAKPLDPTKLPRNKDGKIKPLTERAYDKAQEILSQAVEVEKTPATLLKLYDQVVTPVVSQLQANQAQFGKAIEAMALNAHKAPVTMGASANEPKNSNKDTELQTSPASQEKLLTPAGRTQLAEGKSGFGSLFDYSYKTGEGIRNAISGLSSMRGIVEKVAQGSSGLTLAAAQSINKEFASTKAVLASAQTLTHQLTPVIEQSVESLRGLQNQVRDAALSGVSLQSAVFLPVFGDQADAVAARNAQDVAELNKQASQAADLQMGNFAKVEENLRALDGANPKSKARSSDLQRSQSV